MRGTLARGLLLGAGLALASCGAPAPSAIGPSPTTRATVTPASSSVGTAVPSPAPAAADRQPLQPPVSVRYGEVGQASDAGIYIALERGYFADEGLDVALTTVDGGSRMVPGLGSGQLDVGGGGLSAALVNAVARDIPLRLVADRGSLRPGFGYSAISVRKDLADSGAVRSVTDLKGRRVAMNSRAGIDMYHLDRALTQVGLRIDEVVLEEMPITDQIAALANGAIDAAIPIEPTVTAIAQRGFGVTLLRFDAVVPNSQLAVVMYSPQFVQTQPEAAKRFIVAYLRAVRDYHRAFTSGEDRAAIIAILTKHSSIKDAAVFEAMVVPGLNPNGYLNLDSISATQEFWRGQNLLQATVPPQSFVDHSYVDAALAVLGRVPE